MSNSIEIPGGGTAPASGHYIEVNVFGTPTGRVIAADQGEKLPTVLQGYAWRLARAESGKS